MQLSFHTSVFTYYYILHMQRCFQSKYYYVLAQSKSGEGLNFSDFFIKVGSSVCSQGHSIGAGLAGVAAAGLKFQKWLQALGVENGHHMHDVLPACNEFSSHIIVPLI